MNSEMEITELIGDYLMNRLSETEKLRIKKLINTDPVYREEYEFQEQLKEAIAENELRKKLQRVEDEIENDLNI